MSEDSLSVQAGQIADIMGHFVRMKSRFAAVLPADLTLLKGQLVEVQPECCPGNMAEFNLFYRIGAILSDPAKSLSMSDLSEALAVPLSTATRMVDWMVAGEYARRLPEAGDRRVVRVALTETGARLYQSIHNFVGYRLQQILGRLTPGERKRLVSLLQKIVTILEEEGK
ncbi:MAG: hypothetical protein HY673_13680 [Chloroflexi bacterium]|nr:hypothetical protein [Chloroflexota bacterium]